MRSELQTPAEKLIKIWIVIMTHNARASTFNEKHKHRLLFLLKCSKAGLGTYLSSSRVASVLIRGRTPMEVRRLPDRRNSCRAVKSVQVSKQERKELMRHDTKTTK